MLYNYYIPEVILDSNITNTSTIDCNCRIRTSVKPNSWFTIIPIMIDLDRFLTEKDWKSGKNSIYVSMSRKSTNSDNIQWAKNETKKVQSVQS